MYDFLIVGSGLFGSVFAHELMKMGKSVMVIDKRPNIGGNVYTESIEEINVHAFGIHVFNTNNKAIWDYINQFAEFNNFVNRVKAFHCSKIYSMPINLATFYQIAGCKTPSEAEDYLSTVRIPCANPKNLEEWILSQVGRDLYETLIKGYTTKQWQREPSKLPASIIRRLPIRTTWDDNYYNARYQGIPIGGYTQIIEKMLEGAKVEVGVDFFDIDWKKYAKRLVYTGPIDRFFNYEYGELEYRSLDFRHETLTGDFQGQAQINYTEESVPWTRIIEHKHFEFGTQEKTIITKEYPTEWKRDKEPYYPINDDQNNALYQRYKALIPEDVVVGGRLGLFKYLDMDAVIANALTKVKKICY